MENSVLTKLVYKLVQTAIAGTIKIHEIYLNGDVPKYEYNYDAI